MKTGQKTIITILILNIFCIFTLGMVRHVGTRDFAENIIIPQSRSIAFTPDNRPAIEVRQVDMLIDIIESASATTVELTLRNNTTRRQEAELMFPVPDKSVVRGFAYDGPGGEITAKILPKAEAEEIYRRLVSKIKDPALVEFAGYNLIRSNVFPIEPRKTTKVRLTYEHLLEIEDDRVDYILPRTESLSYNVPWNVTANIKAKSAISTVYSSSHEIEIKRKGKNNVTIRIADKSVKEPGPFRLSYLLEKNGLTASMFAYPDGTSKGGYFLLLAGLPAELSNDDLSIKRELIIVIDRSGSMRGEKIEQVKEAALQVISGLKKGEAFNIITYSDNVEWFSDQPAIKNNKTEKAANDYIESITANGGTNLHEALKVSLNQKPAKDMLPIVLFLTDGLPTVGDTSEVSIRKLAIESNPYERRVFTFGVGVDLNAPLLDRIATASRAKSNYALPGEDVEARIGKVFRQLTGPVLADVELDILDADGDDKALGRVQDVLPNEIGDLFEGDQLVLLGRYVGNEPIAFRLSGNYLGKKRTFRFKFDFDNATSKNGFVPRLWASRKIAELIEQIRQLGAESGADTDDPKIKELVDEIVRLSTEFGILTEYTAFLAKEGTDFAEEDIVSREARDVLRRRAISDRSGLGGVSQSKNLMSQREQKKLNYRNEYFDKDMRRVSVSNIQQINDRAYYRKGDRWIDSRLVKHADSIKPDKIITYGSKEFMELLKKLTVSNRQGSVALGGEVLLLVDSRIILVKSN